MVYSLINSTSRLYFVYKSYLRLDLNKSLVEYVVESSNILLNIFIHAKATEFNEVYSAN